MPAHGWTPFWTSRRSGTPTPPDWTPKPCATYRKRRAAAAPRRATRPATEPAIYTDGDGTVYPNLALGRPYTATGAPYDGNWTDTKADGTPIGKLTDGYACTDGSDTSAGCYKGAETAVTIDLGGVFAVKRITTDLFGNESWGIPSPDAASVTFLVSEDGETFVPFGAGAAEEQSEADGWQRAVFACTAETPVRASHVRVVYGIGGSFCWVSEINAFGVEAGSAPGGERGRFRVRPRFGVVRRSARKSPKPKIYPFPPPARLQRLSSPAAAQS